MDDTGSDVIFCRPAVLGRRAIVVNGNVPVAFEHRNLSVWVWLDICPKRSGNSVLGAANTKRRLNVVKRGKF